MEEVDDIRLATQAPSTLWKNVGMFATRDIAVNELIYTDEPCPLASWGYCAKTSCAEPASELCPGCGLVSFCSDNCMISTYILSEESHRTACPLLRRIKEGNPAPLFASLPLNVKAAARIVLEDYIFKRRTKFTDKGYVAQRVGESQKNSLTALFQTCVVSKLPDEVARACSVEEFVKTFLIISSCSVADELSPPTHASDERKEFFANVALFNHSCFPSATVKDGFAFATRPIRQGDEIFIARDGITLTSLPRYARQCLLDDKWGLRCRCVACGNGSPEAATRSQWLEGLAYGVLCPSEECQEHPLITACKKYARDGITLQSGRDVGVSIRTMLLEAVGEGVESPPLFIPTLSDIDDTDVHCCRCKASMAHAYGGGALFCPDARQSHPRVSSQVWQRIRQWLEERSEVADAAAEANQGPTVLWAAMAQSQMDLPGHNGGYAFGICGPTVTVDASGRNVTATRGDWFEAQQNADTPTIALTPLSIAASLLAIGVPPTNAHWSTAQMRVAKLRRARKESHELILGACAGVLPFAIAFSKDEYFANLYHSHFPNNASRTLAHGIIEEFCVCPNESDTKMLKHHEFIEIPPTLPTSDEKLIASERGHITWLMSKFEPLN